MNLLRALALALYILVKNNKGNIVYFTENRIVRILKERGIQNIHGKNISPKFHSLIETLVEYKLIKTHSKSARGLVYCIDKDSYLWSFIKNCNDDENECIKKLEHEIENILLNAQKSIY